jgi:beta-N-acetylhexosaminidase
MPARAFITGIEGLELTAAERAFLREADPWGLILFKRNVKSRQQVFALIGEFRTCLGRADAPVLVDQEGGRVQRLGPPEWPKYPPGAAYGALFDLDPEAGLDAARLGARLIAADLEEVGIDVDCLPLADVPVRGAADVIGDRAYGHDAAKVSAIAGALAAGLLDGGVLPVLKHLPGHGRANADSHERLPVVEAPRGALEASDFLAFQPLAGLPLGMTAHVVYAAVDPVGAATVSPRVIAEVVRGFIGFDGALMSDDLSMQALSGTLAERTRAALAAGCDLALHCNGRMREMQEVAGAAPVLSGDAARRVAAALARRSEASPIDVAAARTRFSAMMARIDQSVTA